MKYVYKNAFYLATAASIDILCLPLFFLPKLLKKFDRRPTNILVVRLDHIGDFVNTSVLFRNLKIFFPQAKVTALVNTVSGDLAKANPFIDEVLTFDSPWLRKERRFPAGKFFSLARQLRRRRYCLGLEARGDFFSILLMFLSGVKYKVGYGISGGGFLLDKEVQYRKEAHAIEKAAALLGGLSIQPYIFRPQVYCSLKQQALLEAVLKQEGINSERLLVLHPYAGTKAKQWGEGKFRELIALLSVEGWNLLLIGTRQDSPGYAGTHDLRGRLDLGILGCLFKKTKLFLGLDSGPANIALAAGAVTVVVCSGTNRPEQWLVPSEKRTLLYRDTPCKPCANITCPKKSHECMEGISVAEVKRSIDESLL